MKSKSKSKFGTHVFRQKGSMKSQGSLIIWIWIPCSASSIMFCLQIDISQFHLISPIVVVEYRCRGDKQENCLNNSEYQIPGKSKCQNRKIIFTSMTDMPSHVTKREPPASPISQSILYKLCRLSAKKLVVDKQKQKSCFKNEWTPNLTTWGSFLPGNIVSAALASCCYLINPTSQATLYVVPPCKDFVWR